MYGYTPRKIEELSLANFISSNSGEIRKSLDKVMNTTFKGLDNPEKYSAEVETLLELDKKPFPRQARTIIAGFEHLKKNKSLIVSAEMGTGKTLMAISMAFLRIKQSPKEKKLRFGIMCPTTLCGKWKEEILDVIGKQGMEDIEVQILQSGSDLLKYERREKRPKAIFYIFSKETAKLSYKLDTEERSILQQREIDGEALYVCPTCGTSHTQAEIDMFHKKSLDKAEREREAFMLGKKPKRPCSPYELVEAYGKKWLEHKLIERKFEFFCRKCRIQANKIISDEEMSQKEQGKRISRTTYSRISIAKAVRSFNTKGFFEVFFVDELHEMKGGDTGQGLAFASLTAHSKKIVGLTGTILNGYVSSLFYILFRMFPRRMIEMGFDYKQPSIFIDKFGGKETIETIKDSDENTKVGVYTKKTSSSKAVVKEIPVINPRLIKMLMSDIIFLKQDDMNIPLPKYQERVIFSKADVNREYDIYIRKLLDVITDRQNPNGKKLLGAFANHALSILDLPFQPTCASYEEERGLRFVIKYSPSITKDYITNKERKLFELLKQEMSEGRKSLVYINFSQLGTAERVEEVLKRLFVEEGIEVPNIRILNSSVDAKKRKEWIEKNPCEILITNPELVKTGLDLYDYPTIIYHQTGYVVQTIKQASRRAWRIGQTKECRVFFLVAEKTPQEVAVSLVARKIKALNDLEGRIFLTKNELTSVMGETQSLQEAIVNSLIEPKNDTEESEDDFESWTFVARENDPFENYFIQKQEQRKVCIEEKRVQDTAIENNTSVVEDKKIEIKSSVGEEVEVAKVASRVVIEERVEPKICSQTKAKPTRRRKQKSLEENQPNLFDFFGIEY